MQKNDIIECIRPTINLLIVLKCHIDSGNKVEKDKDIIRREFIEFINDLSSNLHKINSVHERITFECNDKLYSKLNSIFDVVIYIMVSIIDDVMNTVFKNWSDSDNSLEYQFFGTTVIGENYYLLSEKLCHKYSELTELFYIGLVLGFDGVKAEYPNLKDRLYNLIPNRLPDDDRHISLNVRECIEIKSNKFIQILKFSLKPQLLMLFVIVILTILYIFISQKYWLETINFVLEFCDQLSAKEYLR